MQQKTKSDGEKKIDKYVFSLKSVIGQGAYATVYLGRSLNSSEPVAIKVIDKKIFANAYNLKNIHLEIDIMKKVQHENIVRLLDVYQTTNNMYIVTEYCEDGDLANCLKKRKRLSQKEATRLLGQIMDGFEYLVERQITHRDLKPANILLKEGICKISDFGFAKNLEDGESTIMRSIVGTPLYMSPQILSRMKYTNKSDLWSIGLIYYELMHGCTPWPAKNQIQLINNIMSKPIAFDSAISEKSRDFIRACLKVKEQDRISWEDAFKHPLLRPTRRESYLLEEDKQNINTNINVYNNVTILKDQDLSSKSLKLKRDISQNKPKGICIDRKTPKTPTRSRLNQILALNLTPTCHEKDKELTQMSNTRSSNRIKNKSPLRNADSSLNLRPKFK